MMTQICTSLAFGATAQKAKDSPYKIITITSESGPKAGTCRPAGNRPRALRGEAARGRGDAGMDGERSAGGKPALRPAGRDRGTGRRDGPADFVSLLPPEVTARIFSGLDVESLCRAAVTCKGWHSVIEGNERLWRRHCLSVRAVCRREIDCDRGNGYSWKVKSASGT